MWVFKMFPYIFFIYINATSIIDCVQLLTHPVSANQVADFYSHYLQLVVASFSTFCSPCGFEDISTSVAALSVLKFFFFICGSDFVCRWCLLPRSVAPLLTLPVLTVILSCGGTVLLAVVDLSPVPRHLPYVEQQSASLTFLTAACNFRLQRIGTVPREIGSHAARRAQGTSSATSFVGGKFTCGECVVASQGKWLPFSPHERWDFFFSSNNEKCVFSPS